MKLTEYLNSNKDDSKTTVPDLSTLVFTYKKPKCKWCEHIRTITVVCTLIIQLMVLTAQMIVLYHMGIL